jgi:hypothetical protein
MLVTLQRCSQLVYLRDTGSYTLLLLWKRFETKQLSHKRSIIPKLKVKKNPSGYMVHLPIIETTSPK